MSLIPWPLHPDAVLTKAWEQHGPGFSAGVEKKMVLIDSPSAATWTQFAAPGGEAGGGLVLSEETKSRWRLESHGLGPVAAPSMVIPLPGSRLGTRLHTGPRGSAKLSTGHGQLTLSWALGHLPAPGFPRGDAPALQKC